MEHHIHHHHHNHQFNDAHIRAHQNNNRVFQENMRRAQEARVRTSKPSGISVTPTVNKVPVKVSDTVVGLATIAAVGYGLYRLFK